MTARQGDEGTLGERWEIKQQTVAASVSLTQYTNALLPIYPTIHHIQIAPQFQRMHNIIRFSPLPMLLCQLPDTRNLRGNREEGRKTVSA